MNECRWISATPLKAVYPTKFIHFTWGKKYTVSNFSLETISWLSFESKSDRDHHAGWAEAITMQQEFFLCINNFYMMNFVLG